MEDTTLTSLLDRMQHPKSVRVLKTRVTEVTLRFGTVDPTILEWGRRQLEAGEPGLLSERPDCPPDFRRVARAVERCWEAIHDLGAHRDESDSKEILRINVDGDGNGRAIFEFECPNNEVFENRRAVVEAARPDAEVKFKVVGSGTCLNFELH